MNVQRLETSRHQSENASKRTLLKVSLWASVLTSFIVCSASLCARADSADDSGNIAGSVASAMNTAPHIPSRDSWIKVPSWLAGTWQSGCETIIDEYDYSKNESVLDHPIVQKVEKVHIMGTQIDSGGNIWHCTETPFVRVVKANGYVEYRHVNSIKSLSMDDGQLGINIESKVTRVLSDSSQIHYSEQTGTTFTRIDDGVIKAEYIIEDFDSCGKQLFTLRKECTEQRIKPFAIVNRDSEHGDLQERFRMFISTYGTYN